MSAVAGGGSLLRGEPAFSHDFVRELIMKEPFFLGDPPRLLRRCCAGISESAGAALGMFLAHVFTLTVLCVTSAVYAFFHVITLHENLQEVCSSIDSCGEFYMFLCGGEVVWGNYCRLSFPQHLGVDLRTRKPSLERCHHAAS